MRIFVSGPYSASTPEGVLVNVQKAMDVGGKLISLGHQPYVPHLSHFWDAYLRAQKVSVPYEKWVEIDLAFLRSCSALFLIDHSPGADIELSHARFHGLAIFHDLEEVPNEKRRAEKGG